MYYGYMYKTRVKLFCVTVHHVNIKLLVVFSGEIMYTLRNKDPK